ncbi:MAG TPA: YfiR family protein, partial [Casimicrobiaceae bacterium]|nr:YfiR family protein [Casimicrobiaceae bacterium]
MPVVTLATEPALHAVCDTRRTIRWQVAAWCLFGYLLVLVAWSAPAPDLAEPSPQPEQQIKAAFLYKFLSYVEWPPGATGAASSPIVIGVLDADDIADELRAIVATRRIGQHPLEVRRVDERNALDGVNVLFVGAGGADALSRL